MNRLKLPTLLEATAITICLILLAGQEAKAGTLIPETTIKMFYESFNNYRTLLVKQHLTSDIEKCPVIDSDTGNLARKSRSGHLPNQKQHYDLVSPLKTGSALAKTP
jgi:hypothetical protein